MSVSSIDSNLLYSLLSTSTSSSSSTTTTSLSTETTTTDTGDTSPSAIVTLGSQSISSLVTTYNAQGLMSAIVQSNPLFSDGSDSGSGLSSVVSAIVQSVQTQTTDGSGSTTEAGDSGDSSSDAGTSGTSSADETGNWVQILKNDPGMAPVFIQNEMEQGLASILGAST